MLGISEFLATVSSGVFLLGGRLAFVGSLRRLLLLPLCAAIGLPRGFSALGAPFAAAVSAARCVAWEFGRQVDLPL